MSTDEQELLPSNTETPENFTQREAFANKPLLMRSPTRPRSPSITEYLTKKTSESPSLKRKKLDGENEETLEVSYQIMHQAKLIKEAVEQKNFNKAAKDIILKSVSELREIAAGLKNGDNQRTLFEAITAIGKDVSEMKHKINQDQLIGTKSSKSYAYYAAQNEHLIGSGGKPEEKHSTLVQNRDTKLTAPLSIIISPLDPNQKSEDTLRTVREKIPFRQLKIAPLRISQCGKGKVKMELSNNGQREEILSHCKNINSFKAEPAKLRNPLLILKGVSKETKQEELIEVIKLQNGISEDDQIRLCFLKKNNRNSETYNAIIEIDPKLRQKFLNMQRVNVDHIKVHVEDFTPILQCFKCLSFGHTASKCNKEKSSCAHCAEEEHSSRDCPIKSQPPTCINCKKHNANAKGHKWQTNHGAFDSKQCNGIKNAISTINERTNYGN